MFTGLIQDTARVVDVREAGEGKRVILESDILQKLQKGDSVSISGTCLTVEDSEKGQFFLAEETMDRTWFDSIQEDDILNMELPLRPEDRMGGHYVQGHIEETVELLEIEATIRDIVESEMVAAVGWPIEEGIAQSVLLQ